MVFRGELAGPVEPHLSVCGDMAPVGTLRRATVYFRLTIYSCTAVLACP